jgi:hypothetical protein
MAGDERWKRELAVKIATGFLKRRIAILKNRDLRIRDRPALRVRDIAVHTAIRSHQSGSGQKK